MIVDPVVFPRLTESNHRVTSPADVKYNCVAWSAGEMGRWWQPGVYWPIEVSRDEVGIGVLVDAFRALGYSEATSDQFDPAFEKVAIFGSGLCYTHAARQLANGKWTSKLGKLEDIEHDCPDDVAGGIYGEVVEIMQRPIAAR